MADERAERCGTCRFWKPTYEEDGVWHYGDCLRYLPTVTDPAAPTGANARFPETASGEWCGEWRGKGVTPVADDDPRFGIPVDSPELELSGRTRTNLMSPRGDWERICTVGELARQSAGQLLDRSYFGSYSLIEVRKALGRLGLALKGENPPQPPDTTPASRS